MSKVAAAVIQFTIQGLRPLNEETWTKSLIYYSRYSEHELIEIVYKIQNLHWNAESLTQIASQKKFSKQTMHCASSLPALRTTDLRFTASKTLTDISCLSPCSSFDQ